MQGHGSRSVAGTAKEQQGSQCEESGAAQGEEMGDEVWGTPGVLTTQAL